MKVMNVLILLFAFTWVFLPNESDVDFKPYIKEFSRIIKKDVSTVVVFGKRPDMVAATCYPGLNHVIVDNDYWGTISERSKKSLIFHELAHCHCKEGHDERMLKIDKLCPRSLMYPKTIDWYCLSKYWDWYILELRSRC